MKNSFIYTVIFTFVLCFVFVLVLSFVNEVTKDKIQENARIAQQTAILRTFGIEPTSPEAIAQEFSAIEVKEQNNNTYYVKSLDGNLVYSSLYSGPGLWGIIRGYIAMDESVSKVVGFSITDQNETPGLGARISEDWFLNQLKNEQIVNNAIVVGSGGDGDTDNSNGYIDGVTGATRTSDSVQKILTQEIERFQKDLGR